MKRNLFVRLSEVAGIAVLLFAVSCSQGMNAPKLPSLVTTSNHTLTYEDNDHSDRLPVLLDPVYSTTPDWVSTSPHYSTGGAFADINNDGWLDFVVSDGNDMGQGHVRVYLNDGAGSLSTSASWESADVAYNGHLDVADINADGYPDIAVSYLGTGSSTGPIARVYLNNNGIPSSTADWSASIIGNAFGVDFGDMNNDGKADLAIATGWSYDTYRYHTYVYLNMGGLYGSSPSWISDDQNIYMGVLWLDADEDGWLDLAGIADSAQTQIYRNLEGNLETTASWYTTDSLNQFGIMLASGDVTGDSIRDLFATDNTQLGGDGYFKQYTGLSTGFFQTTHSWGYYGGYGSAVALADVNGDNTLDLATGAWWENTLLFLNQGTGLPTNPSWSSSPATVVEKIVFGDIGPENNEHTYTEQFSPSGDCRLFYLPHQQIQGIDAVVCDGVPLSLSEYTYSRDEGWVTIGVTSEESLSVTYRYSASQDMGVTNWDSNIGNYLYYNLLEINTTEPTAEFTWAPQTPTQNQTVTVDASGSDDPDGTITVYEWDWDNNGVYEETLSIPTTTHVWSTSGEYPVSLRVTDNDNLSDSVIKTITVVGDALVTVEQINGGLRASAVIKNIGSAPATDIPWSIDLEDGFVLFGQHTEGTIPSLDAGNSTTIRQGFFFGIGWVKITVTAGTSSKTVNGFSFGPLILGVA